LFLFIEVVLLCTADMSRISLTMLYICQVLM